MLRLGKDISDSREVPTCDGCLALNVHFGLEELVYPLFEALDTLIDILNCFIGLFLEYCTEIDLIADLLTDFCRDCLQDVLKLLFIVVNVSGNGPDKLEAVEERLHSINY